MTYLSQRTHYLSQFRMNKAAEHEAKTNTKLRDFLKKSGKDHYLTPNLKSHPKLSKDFTPPSRTKSVTSEKKLTRAEATFPQLETSSRLLTVERHVRASLKNLSEIYERLELLEAIVASPPSDEEDLMESTDEYDYPEE